MAPCRALGCRRRCYARRPHGGFRCARRSRAGRRSGRCSGARPAPGLEVQSLGVAGFVIRSGADAIMTAPSWSNPPLDRVGMLQWNRFDHIVEQGYAHASQVLSEPAPAPAASSA